MKTKPVKIDPINGMRINLPIKFYLGKRYLGIGFITEFSDAKQRREAARKIGIKYYDGVIIQDRDLRNIRVTTKNGKVRKDLDFIHPSDFPASSSITDTELLTNKQRKEMRAKRIKRYHETNI